MSYRTRKKSKAMPGHRTPKCWRTLIGDAAISRSASSTVQWVELDENQQAEMTKLYDQIEAIHARRIEAAAELAKLWQVSLDSVIDQLGLSVSRDDD